MDMFLELLYRFRKFPRSKDLDVRIANERYGVNPSYGPKAPVYTGAIASVGLFYYFHRKGCLTYFQAWPG